MDSPIDPELMLKKAYRTLENMRSLKRSLSEYGDFSIGYTGMLASIKESFRAFFILFEQIRGDKPKEFTEFLSAFSPAMRIDTAIAMLIHIEEAIQSYIDILERDLRPQLSINEKQSLVGLRGDLDKLKSEGLSPILVKNLTIALEELERPNYLTCAMISARATLSMVEKIKANGTKDEDKANKLEELGVIQKGEISNQTYKAFLESIRSARNLVLHDVGTIPDCTDANNFLSSSFRMAKLFLKYERVISNPSTP